MCIDNRILERAINILILVMHYHIKEK